jgi:hypothetical protein
MPGLRFNGGVDAVEVGEVGDIATNRCASLPIALTALSNPD